jgi:UDP-glucose-4-epimerase GalE
MTAGPAGRVLVTGGAGYIGSHTVKALAQAGYEVCVYDSLLAGHRQAVDRIARAFPERRITFVEGDVRDRARVVTALKDSGAQAVLHFAALLSVAESVREPVRYYDNNVVGTLSLLSAMIEAGVSQLVFSSTAATFGEPLRTPIDETHPQSPINPYGETKLVIERALKSFDAARGFRHVVFRYFNAAGADPEGLLGEDHEPEEHLVPRAILAVATGVPLQVFGADYPTPDGTCVRDFIHVTDLADAHLAGLRELEAGAASASYNLGMGDGVSVRDVIASVARVLGKDVPHVFAPRRPGDPSRLVASNARARAALGWTPRLSDIDTIVATAWGWHEKNPKGYGADE